ncbi:hypothetical protein ACFFSH_30990 [Streptomyces filamentosus]|uniref:Uncharacterized protein n=1 Tax=Streptomyces filamentosus TaxID=67294 RepID=A0A919EQZ3_STRFL|nr:hypothetical protein [Streptomyces filamentosus]GHG13704.1 hypothetical protein GCM10017667_54600 [Streptomyces filamentosus]
MSVQRLLDTAFARPALPGARAGRFDVADMGTGPWKQFLLGSHRGSGRTGSWDEQLGILWRRVVAECGVAQQLAAEYDIGWEQLPHETQAVLAVAGPGDVVIDVAAEVLATRHADWKRERRYARIHRRLPADLTGLVPADVGAVRSGLLDENDFRASDYQDPRERFPRWVRTLTGTAAYLAAAHLVPADLALDVATTAPLDEQTRAALRLPAPWSLVVHEPVTLHALEADDDELAALIDAGLCAGPQPAVLGALLAARPDGRIDTTSGFLLLSSLNDDGARSWALQSAAYGDHAAGRALYGYAAQLAFGRWTPPPVLPDPGLRPMSRSALGRIAASEAGRAGAFHAVRVLDFTPPPEEPSEPRSAPATSRGPLMYGTFRRAFWSPGKRIGIRDSTGKLVGPVYKDGAVEGVTFTRERRFFRRTRIRPDLPLAPSTAVYRIPDPKAERR